MGPPSPMRHAVIHYQEIALKKKNRPQFVSALVENLKKATAGLGVRKIEKKTGRLVLALSAETPPDLLTERLSRVFGIANFSLAYRLPLNVDRIKKAVGEALVERMGRPGGEFQTFRITTRRAFKSFPFTSMEIDREVGGHVRELTGARVDLTRPEVNVHVEILPSEAYFYFDKISGPGGLPVGSSGKAAVLLSGGIDSPVAAYRMMQRGCGVVFVHFHSHPFLSKASLEKARELVEVLSAWQPLFPFYSIPFGEIQREIVLAAPAAYRVILYRRMMMRIAEAVARDHGALALVTGESLGQVASQTLESLAVIQEAAGLPILRPLIGMDKEEIMAQARRIGTYEISIQPDQDCCQLFIPKHPVIRPALDAAREIESRLDIPALTAAGVKGAEREPTR